MAQFRDLEAFAQLGTELDSSTQKALDRGYILVEVLKQRQYVPMPVEDQVMVIFAATKGLMDGVKPEEVAEYEKKLLADLHASHPELGKAIRATGLISDDTAAKLSAACKSFREHYGRQKTTA
jgi:F-type H+-transporting ATPase subunit alpha